MRWSSGLLVYVGLRISNSSNIASNRAVFSSQFDAEVAWLPPPFGTLKLNSDATVKEDSPHIGLGAIIRDSSGKMVAALAKPLVGNYSAKIGEFLAIREGLCLAKRFQLKISWVEGDAVNVVSGILSNKLLNSVMVRSSTISGPYLQKLELIIVLPLLELGTWWHIL
ncbi:hypothetical protein QYF36_014754 [Acer negundo]|nr:hypothetical protein QYF36_014754 [Acer negundo]